MTRHESTGLRPLEFSGWIRSNLPDSKTGFTVTNQDWIFWNFKTRRLLLAEEKTRGSDVSKFFLLLIKLVIHPALNRWCWAQGIDYRGYHLIQFENTSPSDGRIWLDRKEVTEIELKEFLSLKD